MEGGVAVCLAGLPKFLEATAPYLRSHLFEPLDADVFLYAPLAPGAQAFDARWLGPRLLAVRREAENISERLRAEAPRRWWRAAARIRGNWLGCWTPPEGAPRRGGSGLCMAYAWRRCLELIAAQEAKRGRPYGLVVQSRPDLLWGAPHPPVERFSGGAIWVPSGDDWGGVSDRHAVMGRAQADVYLGGGWADLVSGAAVRLLLRRLGAWRAFNCSSPGQISSSRGPPCTTHEMWLALRLAARGLTARRFPVRAGVLRGAGREFECTSGLAAAGVAGTSPDCLRRVAGAVVRALGAAGDEAEAWRRLQRWCSLHRRDMEALGGKTGPQLCEPLLVDMLLAEEASRRRAPCEKLARELRAAHCEAAAAAPLQQPAAAGVLVVE